MSDDAARETYENAKAEGLRHFAGWQFVNDWPKLLAVAVSGGSDSMALLDLMLWQGRERGFEVRAVSVDHGLRTEAKDEIAHVADFCAARNIHHSVLEWSGWDGTGNLQAKARKARYALIRDWAGRKGVDWVALGHTRDDQAETVLMRLARASGVDGLAGMPDRFERNGLTFIRPLLSQGRDDLRDYLRHQGIDWCEDPSNDDDSFERVRARKASVVLAELGIDAEVLTRVAWHARSASWALNGYVLKEVQAGLVEEDRGDVIVPEMTPTPEFDVPGEIHRRALGRALQWLSGSEYPPRAMALINMDSALCSAARHTLSGCVVTRIRQPGPRYKAKLRITREYNAVRDTVSSTDALWDGRWVLTGPHAAELSVRALGAALDDVPEWRETGLPRPSLLASPAIWRGDALVAAPLAGLNNGWEASATGRGTFAEFLLSR